MGWFCYTFYKSPSKEMKVVDIVKAGDYVLTGMMNPIESGICWYERGNLSLFDVAALVSTCLSSQ